MRRIFFIGTGMITAGLIAAGCGGSGDGGRDEGDEAKRRVVLEPAEAPGDDPFTTKISYTSVPAVTVPAPVPEAKNAPDAPVRTVSGGAPGLYGGTRDTASCNVEQMVSFLGTNAAQAKAWAAVEGVTTDELGAYLRSLTPVLLRTDTRVTNHGFKGGKATPLQAVLQAGTAVLVDGKGVPRAKCACGNPLLPPAGAKAVEYTGEQWPEFKPAAVVVIDPAPKVEELVLVDPATGEQFARPVGGDGSTDKDAPGAEKVYTGTGAGSVSFTSDVPFAITTSHTLRGGSPLYVLGEGTLLRHPGTYNADVEAPDGEPWKVIVRPLYPRLHMFSGTGDTELGSPDVPAELVVDFQGPGTAGNFYVTGAEGILDNFAAAQASHVKKLSVADHENTGWKLDLWGMPGACRYDESATGRISCAS